MSRDRKRGSTKKERGRRTEKPRRGEKEKGDLRRRNYKFRCSGDGNEPRWTSRTPRRPIKSDYAAAQPNREHRRFAIIRRNFISFSSAPAKMHAARRARHRYFLFATSGFGLSTTINGNDGIKRASLETIFGANNHGFAQRRYFAREWVGLENRKNEIRVAFIYFSSETLGAYA